MAAGSPGDDQPSAGLAHHVRDADFRRHEHRHAAPHRLDRGYAEILRKRRHCKSPCSGEQRFLVGTFDVACQDRNPIGDTEPLRLPQQERRMCLRIVAGENKSNCRRRRQRCDQAVEPLFPDDAAKRQDKVAPADSRRDVRATPTARSCRAGSSTPLGMTATRGNGQPKRARSCASRSDVACMAAAAVTLRRSIRAIHALLIQRLLSGSVPARAYRAAPARKGYVRRSSDAGGRPGRPKKHGMKMEQCQKRSSGPPGHAPWPATSRGDATYDWGNR